MQTTMSLKTAFGLQKQRENLFIDYKLQYYFRWQYHSPKRYSHHYCLNCVGWIVLNCVERTWAAIEPPSPHIYFQYISICWTKRSSPFTVNRSVRVAVRCHAACICSLSILIWIVINLYMTIKCGCENRMRMGSNRKKAHDNNNNNNNITGPSNLCDKGNETHFD